MEKNEKGKIGIIVGTYIFLEAFLFLLLFSSFSPLVSSGVGTNTTVITYLEVGAVYPEILNISVNDNTNVVLTPNATTHVVCQAIIQDWNNETDFFLVNSTLYHTTDSSWDDSDDNNYHYTNASCVIDTDASNGWFTFTDDEYHALANCSYEVEYYANSGNWNCSVYVEDITNRSNREEDTGVIDPLLAVGLPDSINYGIVNSTDVSEEQVANVTNVGNTALDLSLKGYAVTEGDGHAMNCSKGSYTFIDIFYEKYNLTASNFGVLSLSETEALHANLTSSEVMENFDLPARQNDAFNEAVNATYWRIYVPKGLAGTCEGNIVFGAVDSSTV
ncbi:hypothetical protein GW932_05245 [archaeon]|nr:hypothetical protein [archaeon]